GPLIYVYLITVILFQFSNIARRILGAAFTVLGDDLDQGTLNVFRHALCIATHIYMCAALDPGPQVAAFIAHTVLHIDLFITVARPGERQTAEMAGLAHRFQFVLVEEIIIAALMAEIEPVRPGSPCGKALLQERPERRDAGSGPDHDDRLGRIGRQRKMLRLLHIDAHCLPDPETVAEKGR